MLRGIVFSAGLVSFLGGGGWAALLLLASAFNPLGNDSPRELIGPGFMLLGGLAVMIASFKA